MSRCLTEIVSLIEIARMVWFYKKRREEKGGEEYGRDSGRGGPGKVKVMLVEEKSKKPLFTFSKSLERKFKPGGNRPEGCKDRGGGGRKVCRRRGGRIE